MFWIVAGVFALMSLLAVAWPWIFRKPADDADQIEANKTLWKQQQQEIKAQLAAGELSQEDYDALKQELDRRLLQDVDGEQAKPSTHQSKLWHMVVIAAVTLVSAIYFYHTWGSRQGQVLADQYHALLEQENPSAEAVIPVLNAMRAHGESRGESGFDWMVLAARGFMEFQYYRNASETYDAIISMDSSNANFLADAAQAHYLANNRQFSGKPQQYVDQALSINPEQANALGFAGMAAFESQNFSQAVTYWQQLMAVLPPSEQQNSIIANALAEAKRRAGMAPVDEANETEQASSAAITVNVSLGDEIDVDPTATVFVTARASAGPPVPLAVQRLTVAQLPATITLDESNAMSPQFRLTTGKDVVIKAKVSLSGNAISQSGDIESQQLASQAGSDAVLSLVIDQIVP